MKLTKDNYREYVPKKDQCLFLALLIDLDELNELINTKLYIDLQIVHDEYSVERTDPCPDYYGMYRLYTENNNYYPIGLPMNLDELDSALCLLNEFAAVELK